MVDIYNGILLALKSKDIPGTSYKRINHEDIIRSEISRSTKRQINTAGFHLREITRVVIFIEAES